MSSIQHQLEKVNHDCEYLLATVYPDRPKVSVFGEGSVESDIMLIGEAPGAQETEQRRPFVGKAGQNLNTFLEAIGLQRSDLYVTNAVKFRPFKVHPRTGSLSNRPPTREEIALCYPFLMREIALIQPKVIVTLGNTPLQTVLDDRSVTIGKVHGSPLPVTVNEVSLNLFPLYHPASIIYRRELASAYAEDLDRLAAYLVSIHLK